MSGYPHGYEPYNNPCDGCHEYICICKCKETPIVKIQAECPPETIRDCLPLCMDWNISFDFVETSNISPSSFTSPGLFNIKGGCLQSISTVFLAPDRAPTSSDLDQSTITLPIPGCAGSITGEVYLFGDRSDYTASLKPYLLESGKTVTLLTNFIKGDDADSGTSIQLIFVARLFYCAIKDKKKRKVKCKKKNYCS